MVFSASKAKNVQVMQMPKTEDNTIETETKSKVSKTCDSPQYEIMKVSVVLLNINRASKYPLPRTFLHHLKTKSASMIISSYILTLNHLYQMLVLSNLVLISFTFFLILYFHKWKLTEKI